MWLKIYKLEAFYFPLTDHGTDQLDSWYQNFVWGANSVFIRHPHVGLNFGPRTILNNSNTF